MDRLKLFIQNIKLTQSIAISLAVGCLYLCYVFYSQYYDDRHKYVLVPVYKDEIAFKECQQKIKQRSTIGISPSKRMNECERLYVKEHKLMTEGKKSVLESFSEKEVVTTAALFLFFSLFTLILIFAIKTFLNKATAPEVIGEEHQNAKDLLAEKRRLFVIVGVPIFAIAMIFFINNSANRSTNSVDSRRKVIEAQFSTWSGAHRELEKYIKTQMNDPDSYEHVETRYADKGDYIALTTTFRGKNKFGGVVKQTIRAKASISGELIEVY